MARPKTAANNSVISITTTKRLAEHIDKLLETGLYGTTRAAAAERLLADQVMTVVREQIVKKSAAFLESQ